jgi:uncharacterized Zn finger protein
MRVKIRVKCPRCGWTQLTMARRVVRCYRCNYVYTIKPKKKPSRIVSLLWRGTRDVLEVERLGYVSLSKLKERDR